MKLGLRAKYTVFLAGLALSASIVIGTVFLLQVHGIVQKIYAGRPQVITSGRALEVQERGRDLAQLVAASLVAPLQSGKNREIRDVLRHALTLEDVEGVAVYDAKAGLIQRSNKGSLPLDGAPSAEIRDRVLGQGQPLLTTGRTLSVVTLPIRQDGRILGAVSLTLRESLMTSGVNRVHEDLDNLWKAAKFRFVNAITVMVILFLLSNVAIGAYAARRMSAPIRDLAAAAKSIGEGRYDISLPPSDQDEFGELTSALGRMAGDLKKSTVSVIYLDDIISSMREGLIVVDDSGRIEKINRAACVLSGYGEKELIGQPVGLVLPPQAPAAEGEIPGDAVSVPSRLQARDGGQVSILLSQAAITSHIDGRPGTIYVFNDITRMKQREAELGAARDEAQVANRAKSQFLATMSHELRTPLNAIIGFSSMLKDQIGGPLSEKYQSYALDIYESADHLLMIINDLLDISKLEAGKMELNEEPVELSEVVYSAIRLVREKARAKGISIESSGIDEVPAIFGDRRMTKQMVTNLLSNAYKFNVDGGHITVAASHDPALGLDLKVTDTGIGIAKEDMGRIALPFSQVENHISRNFQGTGLGLAITKSMMELHGGNLIIHSEKGRGTSVTLHFPASRIEVS